MIGDLLRRNVQERTTIELPQRSIVSQPLFGPLNVTRDTLLSSPIANRCIGIIADQIASLPLHAERNGERIETPTVLAQPEIDRTRSEFVSALVTSLLINGNAYLLANGRRDALGFPQHVVLLDPEAVTVTVRGGTISYATARGPLNTEEVLHIRNRTLPGHVLGLGPLDYNRQTIAHTLASDQYSANMFTTGALPDGVLQSPNEITSEQAADLKQAWVAGNGGRQRGPAVLAGGVTYQPLAYSSTELELVESRKYNALVLCTLLGVPPHLVGVPSQDTKSYSSLVMDSESFVRYTLRPLAIKIEEAMSTLLPRGQRAVFNFDAVLRADTKTRYEAHAIGLQAGFLTVDEVRELEGL